MYQPLVSIKLLLENIKHKTPIFVKMDGKHDLKLTYINVSFRFKFRWKCLSNAVDIISWVG